jgi:chromosome segregation ATPase
MTKGEKSVEDTIAEIAKQTAPTKKGGKVELPSEPEKPNQEALDAAAAVIDKEVLEIKAELDKYTEQINKKNEGKSEYEEEKSGLQADFDKAKDTFDNLRNQMYTLTDQSKSNRDAGRAAGKELSALERDIKNMDEATIDKKIKELEFRMHTSSMKLAEEKALMKEISDLKKRRPEIQAKARKLAALKGNAEKQEASGAPLEEQIQEVKKKIEDAKADKEAKNQKIRDLRDKRQAKSGNIKELIDKKDELKAQMKEKKDKKWELTQEFNDIRRKHREWEKKCKDLKWQEQKEREDREWEAWEAQKKKAQLEKAAEKPYFEEMTLLQQTIDYCNGLIGQDKKEEETKKAEVDVSSLGGGDGAMLLVKKSDREAEMYLQGRKGKALKQKNKAKTNQNIKHNAGSFALFAQIKVKAPMTVGDVPDCLDKLNAEMEVYNKRIAEWELKRKDIEAEILAADEKVKAANAAAGKEDSEATGTTEA